VKLKIRMEQPVNFRVPIKPSARETFLRSLQEVARLKFPPLSPSERAVAVRELERLGV